mmetsp:Transcript_75493/g.221344  ORF Transcript_75493/g.221344 Transcript_75493/m.221344 type:complete len:301 (+) Transcript_75493:59-961(+)
MGTGPASARVCSVLDGGVQGADACRCPEAAGVGTGRRRVGGRWRRCAGLQAPCTPSRAAALAAAKRQQSSKPGRYRRLAAEAKAQVPEAVAQQIRIDVARTFSGLPQPRELTCQTCGGTAGQWGWEEEALEKEAVLMRVLLAYELRAMRLLQEQRGASGVDGDRNEEEEEEDGPSYVQGCSFLAAMCLGFAGGSEEDCFWLLLHLLEDVLGPDFLARSPALLGYHGDRAAEAGGGRLGARGPLPAVRLCGLPGGRALAGAVGGAPQLEGQGLPAPAHAGLARGADALSGGRLGRPAPAGR